jgi:hypothetical protein
VSQIKDLHPRDCANFRARGERRRHSPEPPRECSSRSARSAGVEARGITIAVRAMKKFAVRGVDAVSVADAERAGDAHHNAANHRNAANITPFRAPVATSARTVSPSGSRELAWRKCNNHAEDPCRSRLVRQ